MMLLPHELERLVAFASDRRWDDVMSGMPSADTFSLAQWSRLLVRLAFFGEAVWLPTLLRRGANPKFKTEEGDTALSECLSGSIRRNPTFMTFSKLLESGADPNEITRGGNRILHLAILENRPEFTALLLLSGADPRLPAPDPDQPDAFRIARSAKSDWAVGMLDRWRLECDRGGYPSAALPSGDRSE